MVARGSPVCSTTQLLSDDRVMTHHYIGCFRCDACRSGWPRCAMAAFPCDGHLRRRGGAAICTSSGLLGQMQVPPSSALRCTHLDDAVPRSTGREPSTTAVTPVHTRAGRHPGSSRAQPSTVVKSIDRAEATDWAATRRMRRITVASEARSSERRCRSTAVTCAVGAGDRGGHAVPESANSRTRSGAPVGSGTAATATCWERQEPRRRSRVKGTFHNMSRLRQSPAARPSRTLPEPGRATGPRVVRPGHGSDRRSRSTPTGPGFIRRRCARTDDCVRFRPSGLRR